MRHSKALIIGGTGQISTALTRLLAGQGYEVTIYNRGQRRVELPAPVRAIIGDRQDREMFKRALGAGHYDRVLEDGFRRRLAHQHIGGAEEIEHDPDPAMTERIDAILARWQQVLRQTNLGETGEGPDPGWERWMENG